MMSFYILQEAIEIRIDESDYRPQFSGQKHRLVEKWDTYQYVPLLEILTALLSDLSIMEQVDISSECIHSTGLVEDFCDGTAYASHPLFSPDSSALQIVAYYDELEIYNPLGSHVKQHKSGIVFYTIAHISPQYRSQLKVINLAIVATVPIIEKHGIDKVLEPFIRDLNILSGSGLFLSRNGVSRTYKGALLAFLGDNLASNDLGGFKKSFSFSFGSCRTCFVTRSSFVSETFDKRNESSNEAQCKMLDGPTASHYSMTYGVNRHWALMNIDQFSMFGGGLPHDATNSGSFG